MYLSTVRARTPCPQSIVTVPMAQALTNIDIYVRIEKVRVCIPYWEKI